MIANLFAGLPAGPLVAEGFDELLARPGLRIERIVSTGQASPPDFWYSQAQGEWVLVLQGAARLRLAEPDALLELRAGDFVNLPPHRRHRVEWTAPDQPTVWLAIHYTEN